MKNKIKLFEAAIERHENQLFGIYLYYLCISLLYKNSPDVLQATKIPFNEIMERGNDAIHDAKILLGQIKIGTKMEEDIDKFHFPMIEGLPGLDEMTQRSKILVKCYQNLFPHKSRHDASELSSQELMQLLKESSEMYS